MTGPVPSASPRTISGDYDAAYYGSLSLEGDYSWDDDNWRAFFVKVASRVRGIVNPNRVLDAGCARGLLVQAFRSVGVDAEGCDISEQAVGSAHPDVRDHLTVRSLTDAIPGRYDLISCIEVLEHMSDPEAQQAIDRICGATDLVLFSSTPADYVEPTHINVRPTADWVASFAERGFFRRTDVSLDFLTPWAVLFARSSLTTREIVHRYETQYAALHTEVVDKRAALLDAHRGLVAALAEAGKGAGDSELAVRNEVAKLRSRNDDLQGRATQAELQLLRIRDHIIGLEATAGTQTRAAKRAKARLVIQRERIEGLQAKIRTLQKRAGTLERRARAAETRVGDLSAQLEATLRSRTWRWGQRLSRPMRGLRSR